MDAQAVYDALRTYLREGELQAFLAALQITRATPHLTPDAREAAVRHWFVTFALFPERCIQPRQALDFNLLSPETFRAYFRFNRHHINELRVALGIPDSFNTGERSISGDTALLMLLRRLASPQRHIDLEDEFGCSRSTTSDITLHLVEFLHDHWYRLLFSSDYCFQAERLHEYARVIREKIYIIGGTPWPANLEWQIVAFLDGSFHETDEPSDEYIGQDLQASAYSGYEKAHGMRFHHLLFPCGIIGHVSRFIAGRQNDAALWAASGYAIVLLVTFSHDYSIEELARRKFHLLYRILTDMGYGHGDYIAMPRRTPNMHADIIFNQLLASLRIPVEWSFGRVRNLWGGVVSMRKIRQTPIAKWYHIAVLLTNCYTCMYGSACSDYYGILPPLLREYLVYA